MSRSPDADLAVDDEGLAPERTGLAWNRSGLAVVVCIAALLRHLWPFHGHAKELALGLVAGAAIVWMVTWYLLRRVPSGDHVPVRVRPGLMALVTAGTLLLAVVGVVVALVVPVGGA